MFAPHCTTCERRVLLGPRRIVELAPIDAELRPLATGTIWLRCFCGTILDARAEAPSVTARPVVPGAA